MRFKIQGFGVEGLKIRTSYSSNIDGPVQRTQTANLRGVRPAEADLGRRTTSTVQTLIRPRPLTPRVGTDPRWASNSLLLCGPTFVKLVAHRLSATTDHWENSSTESCTERHSSRFKNNCFAVLRSSSKEGSYLRLVDFCITQL